MNKFKKTFILGVVALGSMHSFALFAAPIATLSFTTPTGTVGPTDSIPVYVTLSLNPSSTPLIADASGTVTSGYSSADLPAGFNPTSTNLNSSFSCSGTFTSGCSGPPYDFTFASGADSFNFASDLNLQSGSSTTFLFGTFAPTNSNPVASGTYTFYNADFFIQLWDNSQNDPTNGTSPWHVDVDIASTCENEAVSCSFQRTVVPAAVPIPGSSGFMLSGLALLAHSRKIVRKKFKSRS